MPLEPRELNRRLEIAEAKLREAMYVLGYASSALNHSRGWASPKRDWDHVFKSLAIAVSHYAVSSADKTDRAVLGLDDREKAIAAIKALGGSLDE